MLSAPYPLTPSCGGRSHWVCIVKVLFGVWKQNSSPEPTEHSLHILCLFWSLGWTWQYRKPRQRLEFPKKLPCAGEMFSRSWSFLIIEGWDGSGINRELSVGKSSHPGHFCAGEILPGMAAQVFVLCWKFIVCVYCPVRIIVSYSPTCLVLASGTVRTRQELSAQLLLRRLLFRSSSVAEEQEGSKRTF